MNNLLQIMSIHEDDMHSVVFVKPREEGGFSCIVDPRHDQIKYQVFIHSPLPLRTKEFWEFESFEKARSFAAKLFSKDWKLMTWDHSVKRPCMNGGHECGSGSCETCQSTGGGCKSCGATDEKFAEN